MTSEALARAYLTKAQKRLRILDVLLEDAAYSDVVREAQEVTELALKAILRHLGVDPPKQHDVGHLLLGYRDRLPPDVGDRVDELVEISRRLRRERELAFYGDVDFIPDFAGVRVFEGERGGTR